MLVRTSVAIGLGLAAGLVTYVPNRAEACGCTSPPVPESVDFAVAQRAEQIIFEVGDDAVTAHVLIRYSGSPDQFAWLVPVPTVPELALSETFAFPILDGQTAPQISVRQSSRCPSPEYVCAHHPACDDGGGGSDGGVKFDLGGGGGTGGGAPGEDPDGVDVLDMQVIGSYETVTFAAADADLAVQWLMDNGLIVNETMSPYMQPYIDAGMVFVAAKLVAGAGVDEIRPLQVTYAGTIPMIPIRLTAVAADPRLTVTAFIYGEQHYGAIGWPAAMVKEERISFDGSGRTNYPMVLARTVDEAGGHSFVTEYAGNAPPPTFGGNTGCCGSHDWCGVGFDGVCQCPDSDWDLDDCGAIEGLAEGVALLEALADKHTHMTRLTTRLSPEEMSMDPAFGGVGLRPVSRLFLQGSRSDLGRCVDDIIDTNTWQDIEAIADCASVYCGKGTCAATEAGAGCACDAGFVAKMFTDLDGEPSVTCVPDTPPVNLGQDIVLPDVCAGQDCGDGACLEIGGFPVCRCDGATAAVRPQSPGETPFCTPVTVVSVSPGAEDFSRALADV